MPAGWPCTCRASPAPCRRSPTTTTWWARSTASSWSGPRRARAAGVGEVWVDPGIGFGKTTAHNLSLLHHLPELVERAAAAGCAGVLVGTSRKRFLGVLAAGGAGTADRSPLPVPERLEGSLATAAAALVAGAGMVRVHDVAATVQVARLYGPAA